MLWVSASPTEEGFLPCSRGTGSMTRDPSNIQRKGELSSPCLCMERQGRILTGLAQVMRPSLWTWTWAGPGGAVIHQACPHTTPVPQPRFHSHQLHQIHEQHRKTVEGPGRGTDVGQTSTNVFNHIYDPECYSKLRQADRRKTNENKEMTHRNHPQCP